MSESVIPTFLPAEPPGELVSFVERQIRNTDSYNGVERRSRRRRLIAVPVTVQPVDQQFNPSGAPFAAVTRDISPKGIGFVHTEPIDPQLVALGMCLAGERVNLVAEVVWCRPIGPFYYVGGEYVAKLESFPTKGAAPT